MPSGPTADQTNRKRKAPSSQLASLSLGVSLDAMQRAQSTIEHVCTVYIGIAGLDHQQPSQLFRHMALLWFVEAHIYHLDELNERGELPAEHWLPLEKALEEHGWMNAAIRDELTRGTRFWELETRLCASMRTGDEISISDVKEACLGKSFDYRVLMLLLMQLEHKTLSKELGAFLQQVRAIERCLSLCRARYWLS
eukprot:TRINITY_DN16896_c0_g1_i1.p1 TRINITY_DN16896_c0_g1~~TRINITY_DN16896_c0_g1_i1.p1  ORF type:complete len:196 (-),score=50.48 TRINITY_DN16896_c0_g1_i1:244-831(-)